MHGVVAVDEEHREAAAPEEQRTGTEQNPNQKTREKQHKVSKPTQQQLPPWKVILHNDDVNEMGYVVETITLLTPLDRSAAVRRMLEAHDRGQSLLLMTHRERAELYEQQFGSRNLTVTLEQSE